MEPSVDTLCEPIPKPVKRVTFSSLYISPDAWKSVKKAWSDQSKIWPNMLCRQNFWLNYLDLNYLKLYYSYNMEEFSDRSRLFGASFGTLLHVSTVAEILAITETHLSTSCWITSNLMPKIKPCQWCTAPKKFITSERCIIGIWKLFRQERQGIKTIQCSTYSIFHLVPLPTCIVDFPRKLQLSHCHLLLGKGYKSDRFWHLSLNFPQILAERIGLQLIDPPERSSSEKVWTFSIA